MKKMGRPKGENNKECMCTIRLDEATLLRLNCYCEKMKIAKSEAIREAINSMMDETGIVIEDKDK